MLYSNTGKRIILKMGTQMCDKREVAIGQLYLLNDLLSASLKSLILFQSQTTSICLCVCMYMYINIYVIITLGLFILNINARNSTTFRDTFNQITPKFLRIKN